LLPDLGGKAAKGVVERLLESVSMISVELGVGNQVTSLNGAAGIAPYYSGDTASVDELISRAQNALESMRESTYGRVMLSEEGAIDNPRHATKSQTETARR
jgi:GGDEF domain-containing protein